jgi:uncharacterized SAM-binding protein YcdF (DUF218 family)
MDDAAWWVRWLISPLTLAFLFAVAAAVCAVRRRPAAAWTFAVAGGAGLWLASMPATALFLAQSLESRHPPVSIEATPPSDAVVVLGGAVKGALPPHRPNLVLGPAASRVWHAAALYRAGKAKWIVVAAGGTPHPEIGEGVEADVIVEMLRTLGVPEAAIRADRLSRNTRENAANSLPLVQALGAHRVLLVTSAWHMSRAVKSFTKAWAGAGIELVPIPVDFSSTETAEGPKLWLPSASALGFVTNALKEFAGTVVLSMI